MNDGPIRIVLSSLHRAAGLRHPFGRVLCLALALFCFSAFEASAQAEVAQPEFEVIVRDVLRGRDYPLKRFSTYTALQMHHATLNDALLALRAQGHLANGARIVLHQSHLVVLDGKSVSLWPLDPREVEISSPWLAIARSHGSEGPARPEVHVLAADLRFVADLYAWTAFPTLQPFTDAISPIEQSCYREAERQYVSAPTDRRDPFPGPGFYDDLTCLPASLRDPLFYLFHISPNAFRAPFTGTVLKTLNICVERNREFYRQLYGALLMRALPAMQNGESLDADWWESAVSPLRMSACR